MKLVEMKCKNCGATLKVESEQIDIECNYCHAKYKLDDEVQHVKYDDMEQAGYEFEKGKIRARKEAQNEYQSNNNKSVSTSKKSNTWLWVLGWIFFFPAPLTILIWRSNWEQKKKIIVTVVLWLTLLIIAYANPEETETPKEDTNIKTQEVKPSDVDAANKFITMFNHGSDYKIVELKKFDAKDKNSGHYRVEYRLNAWDNNISYSGKIGNASIDIIQYGNQLGNIRIYCDFEDINIRNAVIKKAINIIDDSIEESKIEEIINSTTRKNILLGKGNYISGYVDNKELMIDSSKINYIN